MSASGPAGAPAAVGGDGSPPEDPAALEVCTTTEAARRLGVSNTTVQTMVERGELRAWKTRGGHRRIVRASIEALRAARTAGEAGRRLDAAGVVLLVVEPDAMARRRLEAALAGWREPVRLIWAADAFDALVAVERHRPDVLLTDLRATPIDGFEFLRRLRALPEYRSMAIVVATALDDADLAAHGGLPAGTVRYGAPVPLDTLRGFVEACGVRRRPAPGAGAPR
jgi:excisionase family DNA binding protein